MPLLRYDTPLVLPNGEEVWAVKWEESEHPRQPAGSPEGGEFAESTAAARARREWVAAEQARLEALPGYSRAEARGEAEANWSRGGVIPGSMPVTRVGPADKFKYGAEEPEDPTHFYHITTRPMLRVVLRDGLRPGGPQTMAAGAYRNASYGKVFVTDRQGVAYWRDRIEAHLEHEYDRPPKLDVVRLPRASVAAAPDPNRSHLEANSWVITPLSTSKAWDESQHPRVPAGSEAGGEFTNGGGGAAVIDPKMTAAAARELPEVPFEELGSTGGWLFADGSAHLSDWYQSHASAAAHFLTEALVGDAAWSPQEDDRIIGEFSRRTGAVRIIEGVDGGLGIATARPLSPAQARIAVRYARESGTPLTADFYQHDGTAISQVFPRPTVEAVTAWYDAQYSQTKSAVTKAPAPDLPNLAALADRLAPSLRQDFLDAVAAMQASSAQELEALASALGRGDVAQAETLLRFDALTRGLTDAWVPTLRQGFLLGAEAAMAALQPVVTAGFHLVSQRALEWAHAHAGDLVTEITDETADAIRTWVERGFAEGVPVRELAQQISHLVGLRSDQVDVLARYQAELIDGGMAMGATGDKVGRYANQLLRQRAELIARNEVMTASGEGQWAQWQAAVEEGLIDPDTVQKQWIIAHDERTCPICLPLDGLTLGLNDPFPGGFQHPPAHIQCRCGVGLVFPSAGKGWVVRWDARIKWDESQHPRVPAGSEQGGEFAPAQGEPNLGNLVNIFSRGDEETATAPTHASSAVHALAPKLAALAQQEYTKWDPEDVDTYAGGGICHLIADEIAGALNDAGIEAQTVSSDYEQHVYTVAQLSDGVFLVDIPYQVYERGAGYSWTKLPDVQITPEDVVIHRLDVDPGKFDQYIDKGVAGITKVWDESQHPREPAGSSEGGEFVSTNGGMVNWIPHTSTEGAGAKIGNVLVNWTRGGGRWHLSGELTDAEGVTMQIRGVAMAPDLLFVTSLHNSTAGAVGEAALHPGQLLRLLRTYLLAARDRGFLTIAADVIHPELRALMLRHGAIDGPWVHIPTSIRLDAPLEVLKTWDESQHPRVPAGSEAGGEFTAGDGGGGVATVEAGPDPEAPAFPDAVGGRRLPQDPGDPFWGLQTQGRAGVDHPYDGERPDAPRSWNQAAAWAKALVTTAELPPINREVNAMTWYGHLYYQDCFRQAFQFLLRYQGPGAVLVHGTYEPTGTDPVPAAHAWVELPGHRIFDGVQQRIFDAAQYRALYHTQDVKRYQETAAMRTAVKTQHYGPWWGPGIVARSGGTMAATSTKNKPIPPKELARLQRQLDARKAWDESQHPRVPAGTEQGGEFASGSGAPPPPWGSTADAGERTLIRSMLEREFGLREYQLAIQPGTGPLRGSEFGLARQFVEGGHFDPQTDSIVLWANAHKLHEIISMAAHEAAHARFDWMDRMWKVEQDRLLTESEYPYTTAAETALKPAYQARYPATTIGLELGRKTPPTAELQATGPQVSPYAALYWDAWSRGVRLPRGINTALDETLAEVSRIVHDQNGKYPAGFPEPWRRYHQAREAAYLQMRALPAATSHA